MKKFPAAGAAVLLAMALLGCPGLTDSADPEIRSVTVSPAAASVAKGGTFQFSAAVEGTGAFSAAVTWTIDGTTSVETTLSGNGLLAVAADESAAAFRVIARSAADPAQYGSATVAVTAPVAVSSVTVAPPNAFVAKGGTLQFSAEVAGTGAYSTEVAWTVGGSTGAGTAISPDGLLAVAADEAAETLTVTAASTADRAKYGSVTVNVAPAEPSPSGPSVGSVTVSPADAAVEKGKTLQFSAELTGTGAFSTEVAWTLDGAAAAGTAISASGLLAVAADETAETLTITAASTADATKYGRVAVSVAGPGTPPTGPSVLSVTVRPADAAVEKGGTRQFSAEVTGTGAYSSAVVWTLEGAAAAGTAISEGGLLTVAAAETAATLTVKAASTANNARYGIAAVAIVDPPSVRSVTVSPAAASVVKGGTLQFSAEVAGIGAYSNAVVWTLDGAAAAGTAISAGGLLTVAATETAATLTVKAASTANSAKYGSATVNIADPVAITAVTVSPAAASVVKGETRQFSAAVTGTGSFSNAVVWTVGGNTGAGTSISEGGLLAIAANEGAATLTLTATSLADSTKSGSATVTVADPPAISAVTVSPAAASVVKGGTRQFAAAVAGTGSFSTAVAWTVGGRRSAQTTISESGLLSVAANESAATLTVTAASLADSALSGSATVTVTEPPERPDGLKAYPAIRQINLSWHAVPGAASYEVWYAASPGRFEDAEQCDGEPAGNSVTITGLQDSTVYHVWVKAKDADGNVSPPSASLTCLKTSDPVNPFWYDNVDYWDSGTDGYEVTETTLGYNSFPPYGGGMYSYGYQGDIRYYVEFDLEETARIAPKTQTGKWGEDLRGYPAGVFIIEYREDHKPANRPGDFFGVYFYGLGALQNSENTSPLVTYHIGDRLAYLGNSYGLSEAQGGPPGAQGSYDPETETLEEAIERFTLENMDRFIAFIATPWYRFNDNTWVKGGDFP
jgi:hypothetical protein